MIRLKERGGVKRILLFSAANEMYQGELLPANLSDMWFFQKSNHFKELYLETIKELEKEFAEKRDYKNLIALYSRAASIYPFENWQTKLIKCNLEVYRYDEAMSIYNNTMELYARELGSPPTLEMRECFEAIELMDKTHSSSWREMDRAFMEKKNEIKNAIFNEKNVKGAYYCTYPSFVDYCRLVVRAKERSEFSAVLMFLTLSQKGKGGVQKQLDLQGQMELLKIAIGTSLRIGDAYTRYGNRHFILMLAKASEECCSAIFQRIEAAYMKCSGKGNLWYYTDMTQKLDASVL